MGDTISHKECMVRDLVIYERKMRKCICSSIVLQVYARARGVAKAEGHRKCFQLDGIRKCSGDLLTALIGAIVLALIKNLSSFSKRDGVW